MKYLSALISTDPACRMKSGKKSFTFLTPRGLVKSGFLQIFNLIKKVITVLIALYSNSYYLSNKKRDHFKYHTMKSETTNQRIKPKATIDQIASINQVVPQMLKSIGLDLETNYDKTLHQVCVENQWNETELLDWINGHQQKPYSFLQSGIPDEHELGRATPSEVCDYLLNHSLDPILDVADSVRKDFSRTNKLLVKQYPWLKEADWHIKQLLNRLDFYLNFEKKRFYPLVKLFEQEREKMLDGNAQGLRRSITIVKEDHQQIRAAMKTIRNLTNDFNFDEQSSSTIRILCNHLKSLDKMLDIHLSTEKDYLLPEIEQKLAET